MPQRTDAKTGAAGSSSRGAPRSRRQLPRGPPRLRVLIVRHGQTWHNVNGVIQGQLDTDLDGHGRLQAEVLGKHLSNEKIDEIYSSPLRRASDTATAIWYAQPFPKPKMYVDNRLKERALGELEGVLPRRTAPEPEPKSETNAESSKKENGEEASGGKASAKHDHTDKSGATAASNGGSKEATSGKDGSTGARSATNGDRRPKTGSNVKPSTRESRQRRDTIKGAEVAKDLDRRMASFWNDMASNSVEHWSPDAFNAQPRRIDEELLPGIAHKMKDPANWAENRDMLPSAAVRLNAEFGTSFEDKHIPTIAVAGHGACLSSLLDVIYPYALGRRDRHRMHNCSITELFVWPHPQEFEGTKIDGHYYSPGHEINMKRWPVRTWHQLAREIKVPVRTKDLSSGQLYSKGIVFDPEPEPHILVTRMADTRHLECLYPPEPGWDAPATSSVGQEQGQGAQPTVDNADEIVLEGDKRG